EYHFSVVHCYQWRWERNPAMNYVIALKEVNSTDLELVGGKNASIGEMIQNLSKKNVKVPHGFATTVMAYRSFLTQNNLDQKISDMLTHVNVHKMDSLIKSSKMIRRWIEKAPFSAELEQAIRKEYEKLKQVSVAVRSSATSEDLPTASFAGQQETYLN